MPATVTPNLFAVPPGVEFMPALARAWWSQAATHGTRPAVLLPYAGSTHEFSRALQQTRPPGGGVLPRCYSLGDAASILLGELPLDVALRLLASLPEPASTLARWQFALDASRADVPIDTRLRLTREWLALDEARVRAGISAERFADSLRQLTSRRAAALAPLATAAADARLPSPSADRDALLRAIAQHWQHHPPREGVWIAGSTGSHAATAALMAAAAAMPSGAVILPGFDPPSTPTSGDVPLAQPFAQLQAFLTQAGVRAQDVPWLPGVEPPAAAATRPLVQAMLPGGPGAPLAASSARLVLHVCAHGEEEARTTALLLRRACAVGARTAALISPDTQLLRQTAQLLQREGIAATTDLAPTLFDDPPPRQIDAIIHALAEPESPAAWRELMLLHAPQMDVPRANALLRALPGTRGRWRARLDAALAQHEPCGNLRPIRQALDALSTQRLGLAEWIAQLRTLWALLSPEICRDSADWLEQLATALPVPGNSAERIAAGQFQAWWREARRQLAPPAPVLTSAPVLLLSPQRARLRTFDMLVIGGLSARHWLAPSREGTSLSNHEVAQLGLPPAHLAASQRLHDFLCLAAMPCPVHLTYARRRGTSPETPAPFLERLHATGHLRAAEAGEDVTRLALARDTLEFEPSPPPAPQPAPALRPRALKVSALDQLHDDPFAFYGATILQLPVGEELAREESYQDYGLAMHSLLAWIAEHFSRAQTPPTPADCAQRIAMLLDQVGVSAATRWLWSRSLLAQARWMLDYETRTRPRLRAVESEQPLRATLTLGQDAALSLQLRGTPDRVELFTDAQVRLLDFKRSLSRARSLTRMRDGDCVQLLAYARMLQARDLAVAPGTLSYVNMSDPESARMFLEITWEELEMRGTPTRFAQWLCAYLAGDAPFIATPALPWHHAYDGLSRYQEWS